MIIKDDSLPEITIPEIDSNSDTASEKVKIPDEPQARNRERGVPGRGDWRRYLAEAVRKTLKRRETEKRAQARYEELCGRFSTTLAPSNSK